jgi:hypothetical protein
MSENENTYRSKGKLMDYFVELSKTDMTEDLKTLAAGVVAIVFSCVIFYFAYYDTKALTEQFYWYFVVGIVPAVIGIIIASQIVKGPFDETRVYLYGSIIFVFIISLYLFHQVINPGSMVYVSYVLGFVSVMVLIVGLAILYRIFVRTIINARGWVGFFLKFLFLIPCLLIDALEGLFSELKSAPKMVIALFVLEMVFILAYIYIPRATRQMTDSIVLLNKPVFLTQLHSIGKANQLFIEDGPDANVKDVIRKNYSISMWFYVNQHSNATAAYSKETNIFRYGYPNSINGHPRVAYFNDTKDPNKSDKYIVYVNGSDISGSVLSIPPQSWNQLVISYNESGVDIFVNGNLEKSFRTEQYEQSVYDTGDVIEVGEGDNTVIGSGLHGAICNVVYHKSPITAFQVAAEYNLYRYKNPPVNQ